MSPKTKRFGETSILVIIWWIATLAQDFAKNLGLCILRNLRSRETLGNLEETREDMKKWNYQPTHHSSTAIYTSNRLGRIPTCFICILDMHSGMFFLTKYVLFFRWWEFYDKPNYEFNSTSGSRRCYYGWGSCYEWILQRQEHFVNVHATLRGESW